MKAGSKASPEHKAHISEGLKRAYALGRPNAMKGKHHSQETKKKLSIASTKVLTGKKQTEEHKKNNSIAHKGMRNSPATEFKKGHKKTKEWIELMVGRFVGEKSPRWKGGYERKLWLNNQRRIKKVGNGGSHSLQEWEQLKERHNYRCLACQKVEPEITLSRDHIVPLSRGGVDDITNIQPLCRSCNSIKHNKTIAYV